jgi:hypothetical protein
MYMKISVVTKFYDAKMYKSIYNPRSIEIVVLHLSKVEHPTARKIFFFHTETTQKINKLHVKKYLRI